MVGTRIINKRKTQIISEERFLLFIFLIKKVFDEGIDNEVHMQFQKFSRGEFPNRALIKAKKVKNNYTITTTAEFANEFVGIMAKKLGGERTKVTGAII